MIDYVITFIAIFATDLLYVYFVKAIQDNRPLATAWWSMVIMLTSSIAVINYTTDHWALIPALLGAFFGAYFGMFIKKPSTD